MMAGRIIFLYVLILCAFFLFGWARPGLADPNMNKEIKVENVPDPGPSSGVAKTVVKNPHGFLEYDGTGYRVVTREPRPDKASQVRLKPVTTKEKGTVYILEVMDEQEKPADEARNADSSPRLAVQRVDDLEKRKGVAPEPKKETKADVGVGMKVSESSEVLFGRGVVLERKDNRNVDSRDDGWRFRFKTNF